MQGFLESLFKNSSLRSRYSSVCRETLGLQGEPSAPLLSNVGNEHVVLYQRRLLTWRRAEKRKGNTVYVSLLYRWDAVWIQIQVTALNILPCMADDHESIYKDPLSLILLKVTLKADFLLLCFAERGQRWPRLCVVEPS